jgi:lactate dehydrogenase-like 2-hydroxyacid dehydrogenase
MAKINILIPDVVRPPADIEQAVFGSEVDIHVAEATANEHIADDVWQNCDAVLAFDKCVYDKNLIPMLKKCKVIVRVGVGYDNVDLIETKKNNIVVCNIPDYGTGEVADHTMAFLLSIARDIPQFSENVKKRTWIRKSPIPFRLSGKILGIVGLGRIGTAVALRAKAFGLKVIFYDPYKQDGYDKALGIERVNELSDLASLSDVVSLHVPLTQETTGMINADFFNQGKPGMVLINTARGAVVDLNALYRAMKDNQVKACGLDVLPIEPSDKSQELIAAYENNEEWLQGRLVVTPHVAFYSPEAYEEMRRKAALEAKRVLEGKLARNCVNG